MERAGGDYYPKLQASVPFTPVTGRRFLTRTRDEDTRDAVARGGRAAVKELDASSLHVTFLTEEEWRAAGEAGYLLRTDQQFHWENRGYADFDQFLGELSSSKRKNLRKERAAVREAGIEFDWLTGRDITEAALGRLLRVLHGHRRAQMGASLSHARFLQPGRRKHGRPDPAGHGAARWTSIAGALNFFGDGVLFGRNWGCSEFVPFLHFETCYYQAIDFAIARGLTKVEAGAQGEHKLLRGYHAGPTYSAHYIAHPGLRRAVDRLSAASARRSPSISRNSRSTAPFRKERLNMAYDPNNIFAKILRGELPSVKIYEDDKTLALMDIMPSAEGHTLVIPKEAAESILDLSPEGPRADRDDAEGRQRR